MPFPQFEHLVAVVKQLRHPQDGCPWDLEQTHQSLLKYLLEESYEFLYATENNHPHKMEEELGDVLLQVLLHCTIAEEKKNFDLESVSRVLADKLIRRHPHVFEKRNTQISTSQVLDKWGQIKDQEKESQGELNHPSNLFNQGDLSFPALMSAHQIGKKSKKIRFDWQNAHEVIGVVESEWQELKDELAHDHQKNKEKITHELGDLLFSVAQLARHLKIDPEEALRGANTKFLRRFQRMLALIEKEKADITQMDQKEMDTYWNRIKQEEKK
ncbi:MAG: nucleoside triphosphate pyrophosphohydrolase [Pseudomonadota bacterium]